MYSLDLCIVFTWPLYYVHLTFVCSLDLCMFTWPLYCVHSLVWRVHMTFVFPWPLYVHLTFVIFKQLVTWDELWRGVFELNLFLGGSLSCICFWGVVCHASAFGRRSVFVHRFLGGGLSCIGFWRAVCRASAFGGGLYSCIGFWGADVVHLLLGGCLSCICFATIPSKQSIFLKSCWRGWEMANLYLLAASMGINDTPSFWMNTLSYWIYLLDNSMYTINLASILSAIEYICSIIQWIS